MGALLGLVALAAAIIVGLRALQQRAVERARPGRSPASAIAIEDYGDMDIAVRMQVCRCGGRFAVRGEGPTREAHLRMTQLECRRCEREQRLYFDVSTVRH
jgi:hypothetical protein